MDGLPLDTSPVLFLFLAHAAAISVTNLAFFVSLYDVTFVSVLVDDFAVMELVELESEQEDDPELLLSKESSGSFLAWMNKPLKNLLVSVVILLTCSSCSSLLYSSFVLSFLMMSLNCTIWIGYLFFGLLSSLHSNVDFTAAGIVVLRIIADSGDSSPSAFYCSQLLPRPLLYEVVGRATMLEFELDDMGACFVNI